MVCLAEVHDEVSWFSPTSGVNCGIVTQVLLGDGPRPSETIIIKTRTGVTRIPGSLDNLRKLDFSVDRRGGTGAMALAK